jgi:hypothetical protein
MVRNRRQRSIAASVVVGLLLFTACGADPVPEPPPPDDTAAEPDEPEPAPEPEPEPDPDPAPPIEDEPELEEEAVGLPPAPDPHPPLVLSADEVVPNGKRLAVDIVQALLTYEPDDSARDVVARTVPDALVDELTTLFEPVHRPGSWSRGRIVYPQLGGFADDRTSVMVVAEKTWGTPDGEILVETRTFDVRLVTVGGAWQLEAIPSFGGLEVPRPDDLSAAAVAVLDDERIELPDSARWDIHAGLTAESLLELMATMADRTSYGVIVLETGHPFEVFGTDRVSRHMAGLAVDLYRLDGPNVIDDRAEGSDTHEFVQWLYDRDDVRVIGSPWALDGFGGRSFTDLVHQDHLHIESVPRAGERTVIDEVGAGRPGDAGD